MPSERIQRRNDRLLGPAEKAAARQDWEVAAERASEALLLDEASEDASSVLKTR